jgi:putative serine protease PepD
VKRLFLPMIVATLVGALTASVIFLAAGGSSGHGIAGRATVSAVPVSTAGKAGSRQEVSSTSTPTATQVYQRDASGVVSIKAVTADGEDTGTGIVLNDEGLILTNNHVIAEGTSIAVSPGKSSSLSRAATVIGADANSDLALIKVDPSGLGLQPLKLVSSSPVQVGDSVYAIGNPYGLDETLTKGIVSALGREIEAPDGAAIKGVIQTDAALNPGNSGGPLLNSEGDVIGVNSQIASDAASAAGSQPGSTGVGFAISSNTVSEVIKTIESGGGTSGQRAAEGGSSTESSPGRESSPYDTSPYGVEGPSEAASPYGNAGGGRGEGGETGPYGYEPNSGTEAEGESEGDGGVGGTGAGSVSGGEEGRVVIVP